MVIQYSSEYFSVTRWCTCWRCHRYTETFCCTRCDVSRVCHFSGGTVTTAIFFKDFYCPTCRYIRYSNGVIISNITCVLMVASKVTGTAGGVVLLSTGAVVPAPVPFSVVEFGLFTKSTEFTNHRTSR